VDKAPLLPLAITTALGITAADKGQLLWLLLYIPIFFFLLKKKKYGISFLSAITACLSFTLHHQQISEQQQWKKHIGETLTIEATVDRVLQQHFHGYSAVLQIRKPKRQFTKVLLLAKTNNVALSKGDLLVCKGRILSHAKPRNPGLPSIEHIHWRKHTPSEIQILEILTHEKTAYKETISEKITKLKSSFAKRLSSGLPPNSDPVKVILGVTLGQKKSSDAVTESFRNSGALHIFAVSGMHVGMLSLISLTVFRLLGLRKIYCCWLLIPLLFFYALITGFNAPTARAATMISILLIAYGLRKQRWALNAISLSAVCFLFIDTQQLFQPGFQLSYFLLFVFLTIGGTINTRIKKYITHDPYLPKTLVPKSQHALIYLGRKFAGLVFISLLAASASAPLTYTHFKIFTPIGAITSILIVPQSFALLSLSICSLVTSTFSPSLNRSINQINAQVATLMLRTSEFCAQLPGAYIQKETALNTNDIIVFDLQAGNSILINTEEPLLIDCGTYKDFSRVLFPAFYNLQITPQKLLITHPGGDVTGSGDKLLHRFPIHTVYQPTPSALSPYARRLFGQAEKANKLSSTPKEIVLGKETSLHVLHSPAAEQKGRADDRSLVLQLKHFNQKILIVSDIGFSTERHLLEKNISLQSDILIMGRHSSDFCGTDAFIEAVSPRAIIASHANHPEHERIPKEWAERIKGKGIQLYHQGHCGGVTIRTNNENLSIHSQL